MRLAHISDLHVLDLTDVSWTRFLNKRFTGLINLVGHRRKAHSRDMLDRAIDCLLHEAKVDRIALTGDLSNLSLDSEFAAARQHLAPIAERLCLIPGNHDVYTRGAAKERRFEKHFGDWLFQGGEALYPWRQHHQDIQGTLTLFGFCSALPRAPLVATGTVSTEQLERFKILSREAPKEANEYRVALVHHNLHPRSWRKDAMHGLTNRDHFLATLAQGQIDLLLHGHTHVAHRFTRDGITIVGAGSTTWDSNHEGHLGRFNVYDIQGAQLVETEVWRYDRHSKRYQRA